MFKAKKLLLMIKMTKKLTVKIKTITLITNKNGHHSGIRRKVPLAQKEKDSETFYRLRA